MISLNCPNCGGKIERRDDKQYSAKCPYCGGEVYFEAIHSDAEFARLQDTSRRLEQDQALDDHKRKELKGWILARNIVFLAIGLMTLISWIFLGYGSAFENEDITGIGALIYLPTLLALVLSPIILALKRTTYDVIDRDEDKMAKVKAFFSILLINVAIMLLTILLAYIVCAMFGWD